MSLEGLAGPSLDRDPASASIGVPIGPLKTRTVRNVGLVRAQAASLGAEDAQGLPDTVVVEGVARCDPGRPTRPLTRPWSRSSAGQRLIQALPITCVEVTAPP